MNLTFRQLRVFTEVAQQGSMIRAAAALHLTPPAVSMPIKEQQADLALDLFDLHRDRRGREVQRCSRPNHAALLCNLSKYP